MAELIKCPECGAGFELDDALQHQMEERLQEEFEAKRREIEISHQEALRAERESADAEAAERLALARQEATEKAREDAAMEIESLRQEAQERAEKLKAAQQLELDLRRKQRDLQEREQTLQLQLERDRAAIRDDAAREARDQEQLRVADKERQLQSARKQIEDLQKRLEQGSQQAQGEVLELELEDSLKQAFPTDEVAPVGKGVRGADVMQRVCVPGQPVCGSILWEAKRTRSWNQDWIEKLEEDRKRAAADVAVIVSVALPPDVEVDRVANIKGIWVTDFTSCVGFATVLRAGIIKVAAARATSELENEELELVRKYLCQGEFSDRVEAIAQSFIELKLELDAEKRAFEKLWKKREVQLSRGLLTSAEMYGALDGMLRDALPDIPVLELPAG